MPLCESFAVDHTRMKAPAVRLAKTMRGEMGDEVRVFDLRFCPPNREILSERGIHTLEHLFAGFMRVHLSTPGRTVIDLSPMGCRTGFYLSVLGGVSVEQVIEAWRCCMEDVLRVPSQQAIPELNVYQCGSYHMHSLEQAQHIARQVLERGIDRNDNAELGLPPELWHFASMG